MPPDREAPRLIQVDLGALAPGVRRELVVGRFADADPDLEALARHSGSALAVARLRAAGPRGRFLVAVGRAVREGLPTAARASVLAHAPLAGRVVEGLVGGDLARRLARLADALELTGRAACPGAVLALGPAGVALHSLPELEGRSPGELAEDLERALGPGATLRVGPAARAGVAFANLASGGATPSFVGRGGLGAAFASHGLLALHVGGHPLPGERGGDLRAALLRSPRLAVRAAAGTLEQLEAEAVGRGALELERAGRQAGDLARVPREVHGCAGCPTPCGWVLEGPGGAQGARHNALRPLGRRLGLEDPEDVLRLLGTCNRLGIDAREAGDGLALLGLCAGDVAGLEDLLEGLVAGRGPAAELREGAALLAARRGLALDRDELPADLPPVLRLARLAGVRGPEPMRSFPFLLERPSALPEELREAARRPLEVPPELLARLVAWHEDLVLALDATGFCTFSAAGLLTDGLADVDGLARWLGFAGGDELLDLGAELARRHLELGGGELVGSTVEELPPELAAAGRELVRLRLGGPRGSGAAGEEAPPAAGAPPGPSPTAAGRAPGCVVLCGFGPLARRLGGSLELELALPASVAEVLRAAARERPDCAAWLLAGERPLPSVHRAGRRLDEADEVHAGDALDLVLAIPGG